MNSYWNDNLKILARCQPNVFEHMRQMRISSVGQLVETADGDATIIFGEQQETANAGSAIDPWQEVATHLETVPPDATGLALFVGMGLGYGPLLVLKKRPDISKIVILEPSAELFATALRAVDLSCLLESEKVCIHVGEIDFSAFKKDIEWVAALYDSSVLRYLPAFRWQPELYGTLSDKAYDLLNRINVSGATSSKMGPSFFKNRLANITQLRHLHSLDLLEDVFKGKPAVLVAAGPSLNQNFPVLRKLVGRCIVIAVDSALAPLLHHDIMPDFVTCLDMDDMNFEKIAPFVGEEWPFSLVSLVKATPLISKRLAAKHQFLAFQEDLPHNWMIKALGVNVLVPQAFAVAQLSLGLAQIIGADPIIFVGQDLAYTDSDSDHAAGTLIAGAGTPVTKEKMSVKGIDGRSLVTTRDMLGQKKITEELIALRSGNYINATAAGAHIEGTSVLDFAKVGNRYMDTSVSTINIIDAVITDGNQMTVDNFLKLGRILLKKIDLISGKMRESLKMNKQLIGQLSKFVGQSSFVGGDSLPPRIKSKFASFDCLSKELDSEEEIWHQLMELSHAILRENELKQTKNQKLQVEQGFLPWLLAELERVAWVNRNRLQHLTLYKTELGSVVSHLEKEKKLLGKKSKGENVAEKLLQLYLQSKDYRLATKVVEEMTANLTPGICISVAEGYAGLLDFAQADRWWNRAVSKGEKWKNQVLKSRINQIEQWISAIEINLNLDDPDYRFPQLLEKWLGRILRLLDLSQPIPTKLCDLWGKYETKLIEWIDDSQIDSSAEILAAWNELGDVFSGVKCLKARLLITVGQYDQGIAALVAAVEMDTYHAILWEEIGDALYSSDDFSGAVTAFEHCFVALPKKVNLLSKIGDCYFQSGQHEAAKAAYQKALQENSLCIKAEQGLKNIENLVQ